VDQNHIVIVEKIFLPFFKLDRSRMVAKRAASSQITKDTYDLDHDDGDDLGVAERSVAQDRGEPKRKLERVLSVPKRSTSSPSSSSVNPFAKVLASPPAPSFSSPSLNFNPSPNDANPSPNVNPSLNLNSISPSLSTLVPPKSSLNKEQLVAERDAVQSHVHTLNARFVQSVQQAFQRDPGTDLTSLFSQYVTYRQQLAARFQGIRQAFHHHQVAPLIPQSAAPSIAAAPVMMLSSQNSMANAASSATALLAKDSDTKREDSKPVTEVKPAFPTLKAGIHSQPSASVFTFNPADQGGAKGISMPPTAAQSYQEPKLPPQPAFTDVPKLSAESTAALNPFNPKSADFSSKQPSVESASTLKFTFQPSSDLTRPLVPPPTESSSKSDIQSLMAERKEPDEMPKFSFAPRDESKLDVAPLKFLFGSDPKPAFTFNPPSASDTSQLPPFTFNSTSHATPTLTGNSLAPSFSFATTSFTTSPSFGGTSNGPEAKPAVGFSFSPSTSFTSPSSFNTFAAAPFQKDEQGDEEQDNETDENVPMEASLHPQFTEPGAGEEGERTVLSVRCKLYLHHAAEDAWREVGVGVLKVNQESETNGKIDDGDDDEMADGSRRRRRLLMRSEGTGRVLLNARLQATLARDSPSGKATELLLLVLADGQQQQRYLVRAKEELQPLRALLSPSSSRSPSAS
jgi:hypothetical protein